MKFKSLLLLVGFIPALAMAEIAKPTAPEKPPTAVAKPAPEKAPPVVTKPAVVTHVHVYHHYYYHHHGMYQSPREIHHYYQSGPPQISKPTMEGGARMMDPANAGHQGFYWNGHSYVSDGGPGFYLNQE